MSTIPLQSKTIYIYEYLGYNGGYARTRTLLWKCILVGINGKILDAGSWMSEGYGNPNKKYALEDSKSWAAFLDWPVVDLGRCAQFDRPARD